MPVEPEAPGGARASGGGRDGERKQADAGIDIVNDGEMSKPSYATYVKDRLAGFGGTGTRSYTRTLPNSPISPSGCSAIPGAPAARRPACNAAIAVRDAQAAASRRRQSQVRARRRRQNRRLHERGFSRRRLAVLPQRPLPSQEAYLFAIAQAMRHGIRSRRQGRPRAADRLPRSRHGPAHPIRRAEPRGIP